MKAFISYAEKVPAAAAQIKANLKLPMPATFVKYGSAGFGGFADYYTGDAKAAFADVKDPALQKQFDEVAAKAAAAMKDLAAYVAVSYTHLDVYKRQEHGCCSDLRQEVGHRQIALAGVIVEAQDAAARRKVGELLLDRRQRRARRDADEHPFLGRRAPRHLLRIGGIDLDHAVEQIGICLLYTSRCV